MLGNVDVDQMSCCVENGQWLHPFTYEVYSQTITDRGSSGNDGHADELGSAGLVAGEPALRSLLALCKV